MFCNFCGAENRAESRICSGCGKPLAAPAEASGEASRSFTVEIFRTSQTFLLNPPMNVMVDGERHDPIANGETVSLRLPQGRHTILFERGLRRRELTFDLAGGCKIIVQWNRLTGNIEAKLR